MEMEKRTRLSVFMLLIIVHVTSGECPYRCYCTGTGVYCHGNTRFPDFSSLPSWTMNISIYQMNIPHIPAAAFKNVPNVKTISIYEGSIGQIHPCAFQGLRNVEKVEMYNVQIKAVEMYAFSDIRYVKTLAIYKSRIDSIHSYAFYNIKGVKTLTLHTLNVKIIEPNAFYAVGGIDAFYLYGNNITTLRRGAFSRSSFKTVNVFYNYFINLECQTIDVLKGESTKDFHFYDNDLHCGCQVAWLLQPDKRALLADNRGRIRCNGPNPKHRGVSVLQLTTADLGCQSNNPRMWRMGCPKVNVPPPARTRARQCLKRY